MELCWLSNASLSKAAHLGIAARVSPHPDIHCAYWLSVPLRFSRLRSNPARTVVALTPSREHLGRAELLIRLGEARPSRMKRRELLRADLPRSLRECYTVLVSSRRGFAACIFNHLALLCKWLCSGSHLSQLALHQPQFIGRYGAQLATKVRDVCRQTQTVLEHCA